VKGRSRNLADLITALIAVAILYVLVRPGSAGADLVKNMSGMFVAIVKNAADLNPQAPAGGLLANVGNQVTQFVHNLKSNGGKS